MNLFLDDIRNPYECLSYTGDTSYSLLEWQVVRDYHEFVDFIGYLFHEKKILPELISFDHDLADEHYDPSMYQGETYNAKYPTFKEKTGYDCAKWLVEFCLDNKVLLPKFKVHSMNPAGGKNISGLLEGFKRFQEENS